MSSRHFGDLSRHFGTNRYTLIIEIAASPTKQTVGTRANRYNLPIPGLRVCTCKPCVQRCRSASRATSGSRGEPTNTSPGIPRPLGAPKPLAKAASPHFLPPARSRSFGTNNETAIRNRRK